MKAQSKNFGPPLSPAPSRIGSAARFAGTSSPDTSCSMTTTIIEPYVSRRESIQETFVTGCKRFAPERTQRQLRAPRGIELMFLVIGTGRAYSAQKNCDFLT